MRPFYKAGDDLSGTEQTKAGSRVRSQERTALYIPFHKRVSRELDAMDRDILTGAMLAMLAGGLLVAAMFLAAYVIL